MGDPKTCSELTRAILELGVQCGHCGVMNYIREELDPSDNDASKVDIEAITCWGCSLDSLVDESLLAIYPNGVEEQVNTVAGHCVSAFT
ncbi:MAG: hypothetical protein ACXAC5_03045 [Promethearchaeota archaeon]